MYDFLENQKILFENQFGFRKNNSTTYALMEITEKIKESIDRGKFGCGIFIDLRKADTDTDTDNLFSILIQLQYLPINYINYKIHEKKNHTSKPTTTTTTRTKHHTHFTHI